MGLLGASKMEVFPLFCPPPMRIIAFITDVGSLKRILEHPGEPTTSPPIASARGPPHGEKHFDRHEGTDGTDLSERAASESQGHGAALLGGPRMQRQDVAGESRDG